MDREKLIMVLQAQRNAASDNHAHAEVQIILLREEIATLKLKIAEMEKAVEQAG